MKIISATAALLLTVAPAFALTATPAPQADASKLITQDMSVDDIEDKEVYRSSEEHLADIDNLLIGPDKKIYAVIEFGGFLGLGQEHRLVALEELALEGDRLIFSGRTEDDLKNLPAWDSDLEGYSELDSNDMVPVRLGTLAASPIETPAAITPPATNDDAAPSSEPNASVTEPDTATPAPAAPAP